MDALAPLFVDITPKIVKVTADVELYAAGQRIGTTTVDLTPPEPTASNSGQQTPAADEIDRHLRQQTSTLGYRG